MLNRPVAFIDKAIYVFLGYLTTPLYPVAFADGYYKDAILKRSTLKPEITFIAALTTRQSTIASKVCLLGIALTADRADHSDRLPFAFFLW
jgi:hypothetical protein